jgi:ribosome recycling factor
MLNESLSELKSSMEQVVVSLKRDMVKVRTGRANLGLLDGIMVDYYGTPTPLNQVANLQIADARLITIKPWEKAMLAAIEKAIIAANIGITPSNNGELIRLPIPPLTEERRRDIVKKLKGEGEDFKIRIRNLRRETNDFIKSLEKEKEISEDEMRKGVSTVQEITNEHIKNIDVVIEEKEKEILSF